MASVAVAGIAPEMFVWARQSVGLSQEQFAKKMNRALDEIRSWETGASSPTYAQLEKIAYEVCKRPLATFFLPAPPEETIPSVEFRTLPSVDLEHLHPNTFLHIRKAHAFQIGIEELLEAQNTYQLAIKLLDIKVNLSFTAISAQAYKIREFLQIKMAQQNAWKSDELALKEWRNAIESKGIFIFKESFKQNEISGFCLSHSDYPVIYLNNSTTKTRQIFSLLHEFAHVLLQTNGISKFEKDYIEFLPETDRLLEQFCNALAAEILIPNDEFMRQVEGFPHNVELIDEGQFAQVAQYFSVSREAVLRRFLDMGRISVERYRFLREKWNNQIKSVSGGSYFNNQGVYLSEKFTKEVITRHLKQQLSLEQAAEYLGLKPKVFDKFEARFMQGAGL